MTRRLTAVLLALLVASMPVTFAAELRLTYDANGNLVTGDGKFRVYNSFNQLASVYNGTNTSGTLLETYLYHPTEERILVKKTYAANGTLNQTTYYLSPSFVRVVNNLGGASSTNTLPQLLANFTFCTDTQNFTLGSGWQHIGCVLSYNGSDFGGILSTPNLISARTRTASTSRTRSRAGTSRIRSSARTSPAAAAGTCGTTRSARMTPSSISSTTARTSPRPETTRTGTRSPSSSASTSRAT